MKNTEKVGRVYLVGAGALRALEPIGIHADLVAATPTTTGLAEQMATQLDLKGRRAIRVRGNLGDERVDKIPSPFNRQSDNGFHRSRHDESRSYARNYNHRGIPDPLT